jgi:hypothetical protein
MDDVATLLDIEAIKQLKARYCRHLDAKDWGTWRELFDDDFTGVIAGAGGRQTVGADDFVVYVRQTLGKRSQPTVHQVYAPEITLASATTATGVLREDISTPLPQGRRDEATGSGGEAGPPHLRRDQTGSADDWKRLT